MIQCSVHTRQFISLMNEAFLTFSKFSVWTLITTMTEREMLPQTDHHFVQFWKIANIRQPHRHSQLSHGGQIVLFLGTTWNPSSPVTPTSKSVLSFLPYYYRNCKIHVAGWYKEITEQDQHCVSRFCVPKVTDIEQYFYKLFENITGVWFFWRHSVVQVGLQMHHWLTTVSLSLSLSLSLPLSLSVCLSVWHSALSL